MVHVTADVEAAILWLTNRRPEGWSKSHKLKHTGGDYDSAVARPFRAIDWQVMRPKGLKRK